MVKAKWSGHQVSDAAARNRNREALEAQQAPVSRRDALKGGMEGEASADHWSLQGGTAVLPHRAAVPATVAHCWSSQPGLSPRR